MSDPVVELVKVWGRYRRLSEELAQTRLELARAIHRARVEQGHTYRSLAPELGLSGQRLHNIVQRERSKLAKAKAAG